MKKPYCYVAVMAENAANLVGGVTMIKIWFSGVERLRTYQTLVVLLFEQRFVVLNRYSVLTFEVIRTKSCFSARRLLPAPGEEVVTLFTLGL